MKTTEKYAPSHPWPQRQAGEAADAADTVPLPVAGALLTVDLGAIRSNYRLLRSKLGGARCAAVVKADGYGLGAFAVARALMKEGCDTFFVAHLSEGLSLRAAVGEKPAIYVLNGLAPGSEGPCADAGLRPVLNSAEQALAWKDQAKRRGEHLAAAIQIDTGMSRLGMSGDDVAAVTADGQALAGIRVTLVMSHLACADEPDHPANRDQLAVFETVRGRFGATACSLANSSGIFLGRDYHFDLARPGAALYGINPTPGLPNPMAPVIRLSAKVIQTRTIGAGVGIGYGHSHVTGAPMRMATIALGYADGWHRRAAGGALFGGKQLPFVGRVSMDSIILDISALPEGALRAGDLVDLINDVQTVDSVAGFGGTIGYEVLTGLGSRFHREHVDGSDE